MGSIFFKSGKECIKTSASDFFSLKAEDIDGKILSFSELKSKKAIIVVNVASACGFTKAHYRGLNALYEKYR
jgi:glutathione peroxidase-family protein